jgi:Kef-type K+ transport system membrane component KefB
MMPRGEVGLVVAQIGSSMGIVAQEVYAVVVFMAVATTLIAPPLLVAAFRGATPPSGGPQEEQFRLG